MSLNKSENVPNLLDFYPHRSVEWERNDAGRIVLLVPRFSNRWMVKNILSRMKNKHLKIHLDEFGSWVWQRLDGRTAVREIGTGLVAAFGDSVEPVYPRLGLFINALARRRYIFLKDSGGDS